MLDSLHPHAARRAPSKRTPPSGQSHKGVQRDLMPHAGRSPRTEADDERSRRYAVEFSKTEPRGGGQQKTSDSRQRPSGRNHRGRIRSLEGAPFVELQASCSPLSGGLPDGSTLRWPSNCPFRRIWSPLGSAPEPHETALSRLHECAVQGSARDVEIGYRFAVDSDAALGDHASRLARREPERLGQHTR